LQTGIFLSLLPVALLPKPRPLLFSQKATPENPSDLVQELFRCASIITTSPLSQKRPQMESQAPEAVHQAARQKPRILNCLHRSRLFLGYESQAQGRGDSALAPFRLMASSLEGMFGKKELNMMSGANTPDRFDGDSFPFLCTPRHPLTPKLPLHLVRKAVSPQEEMTDSLDLMKKLRPIRSEAWSKVRPLDTNWTVFDALEPSPLQELLNWTAWVLNPFLRKPLLAGSIFIRGAVASEASDNPQHISQAVQLRMNPCQKQHPHGLWKELRRRLKRSTGTASRWVVSYSSSCQTESIHLETPQKNAFGAFGAEPRRALAYCLMQTIMLPKIWFRD